MFILINNIPCNAYDISSFNKRTETRQNSDGTDVTIYEIIYQISNGSVIIEEFESESDRDDEYTKLVNKLVVDLDEDSNEG